MKVSSKNYKQKQKIENREDILIFQEIINSKLFDNLSIVEEVRLCIEFIKLYVLPLSHDENFEMDIRYAQLYLENQISPKKLRIREQLALNNYERLTGLKQQIQELILIFLNRNVLDGTEQNEDLSGFLSTLTTIQQGLCEQFLIFSRNILNSPKKL